MGSEKLKVLYGKDQEELIDKLLEQQIELRVVIDYAKSTEPPVPEGFVQYIIFFDNPFNIYLFGHAQGNMYKLLYEMKDLGT